MCWIKLHRKFTSWEWYKSPEMVRLFIHLLLECNYADTNFEGMTIRRGQLLTGRKKLSTDTGLTEQQIRTCLNRLVETNELSIEATNKYSLITISNYNEYQDNSGDIRKEKKLDNINTKKNNMLLTEAKIEEISDDEKEHYNIAIGFYNQIADNMKSLGIASKDLEKAKLETWLRDIRLMITADNRTIEELREVVRYLKNEVPDKNGFSWKQNVRSSASLRKHFEKILIKSRTEINNGKREKSRVSDVAKQNGSYGEL